MDKDKVAETLAGIMAFFFVLTIGFVTFHFVVKYW